MSLILTSAPSGMARTTMFSNSATVVRRPWVEMLNWNSTSVLSGAAPMRPTAAWAFCACTALTTSAAVMSRLDMRSRLSQTRIE
jgi:hypothetical protein